MDGLIPFIFKVLKKKKAMTYYRSLSSAPAHIDVAELTRQDLFMTPQHPRAPKWHEGDTETMTPLRERAKNGNAQARRIVVMEAMPRETFSPRRHKAAAPATERGSGRNHLGGR